MPHDRQGGWKPQAHRVGQSGQDEKKAAEKPLHDFERAVRPETAREEREVVSRENVQRLLMMELRPDGTALILRKLPTRDQDGKSRQIYKWGGYKNQQTSRHFQKSNLTKEFAKENNGGHNNIGNEL